MQGSPPPFASARRRAAGPRDLLRRLARHPTAVDGALAAALGAGAVLSFWTTLELLHQDPRFHEPARLPIALAQIAVVLPLALRRRYPLAVACAVAGLFVGGRLLVSPGVPGITAWEGFLTVWACWLALYGAVAHGPRTRRTALVVAALVVVLFAEAVREVYFYKGGVFHGLPFSQAFLLAYNAAFLIWPVVLGLTVRALRERQRELAEQAAELQRQREENARQAVLEERVRIARELHDVVAHHVSVMGVQAAGARRVLSRQPERAAEALGSIEQSSRLAVAELHRLLGFLRRAGQDDGLAPQPDLSRLPELVDESAQGALRVELEVEGEPRPLPGTLELSAYRVIQEALTNVRKHSAGSAATVRLGYRPTLLEVEVVDDGPKAPAPADAAGGHGLIGMRERVRLHGGHLRVGPLAGGGFAVHATFPFGESAA